MQHGWHMGVLDIFQRELTPERFVALVLRRMQKMGSFQQLSHNEGEFSVKFRDVRNSPMTFNLHNVYKDYQKAKPKGRAAVLDKYLLGFSSPPDMSDRGEALKNLMPVIRDKTMFENAILMGRLSGVTKTSNNTPTEPFLGHLVIALVVDSEHSTMTVSQGKLEEWGLDFNSALKLAINNLRDKTEEKFRTNGKGVFISAWCDVYDASRLLLTDMLYRLPIQGDPVVAIPSRNHLLVTGSRNEQGIAEITDLTVEVLTNDTRPLAEQLFQFCDGKWLLFEGTIPGKERLNKARCLRTIGVYEDQKKLLTQVYEKEKNDIFVASYRVYDNPELGGFIGTTQWTRGVVTLLPKSDYLWLYCNLRKEIISVRWDAAVAIVGGFIAEPALHPERFLVTEFPSDDQLAELRRCAVNTWTVPDKESTQVS